MKGYIQDNKNILCVPRHYLEVFGKACKINGATV